MTVAQLTCRHCSAQIEQEDRFCWDCGVRLTSSRLTSPLLERHRIQGSTGNPLIRAELILMLAMGAFVVSAVAWTTRIDIAKMLNQPAIFKEKKNVPAVAKVLPSNALAMISETHAQTEIDRLLHQAKHLSHAAPKTAVIAVVTPSPAVVAVGSSTRREGLSPSPTVLPVSLPIRNSPVSNSPEREGSSPLPTAAVSPVSTSQPTSAKQLTKHQREVDNVAEYNSKLAAYFSRKRDATAGGAIDGVAFSAEPVPEPPTYQEWISAGKPQF